MSHFCVLVIGDDVEGQLAPYDEELVVARYVEYTREQLIANGRESVMQYLRGMYLIYMRDPGKYIADALVTSGGDDPASNGHLEYLRFEYPLKWKWTDDQHHAEQTEYYEPEDIGILGEVYSTRNPKAKWDWYQPGGRYAGRLWLKQDVAKGTQVPNFSWGRSVDQAGKDAMNRVLAEPRVDSALLKDLDLSKMHGNHVDYAKAARFWDMKVNGAEPVTDEEKEEMKWDWYREGYYQDRYKDIDTYARCMSNFTAWAYVKDGEWYEKGSMGWWGMSGESDEEAVRWELEFFDSVIKPLDPETRITIVDCHI